MRYRLCPRGCGKKMLIKNERNEVNILQTHFKNECKAPFKSEVKGKKW